MCQICRVPWRPTRTRVAEPQDRKTIGRPILIGLASQTWVRGLFDKARTTILCHDAPWRNHSSSDHLFSPFSARRHKSTLQLKPILTTMMTKLLNAFVLLATIALVPVASAENNLIVILTDQQRYDTIRMVQEERGWSEHSRINTPTLDRIAREGAYFRNAYTHCAVCVPARASLLTGSTVENTGIRTNGLSKDENLPGNDAEYKLPNRRTYDDILVKDHGYVAEYYGKWHTPNSMAVGVYDNDVRRGAGAKAFFGKMNDDGTKHYSWGMNEWYRMWLAEQSASQNASLPFEAGDQINTYSKYYYDPDPLDTRYGMSTGSSRDGVRQPDQHGLNRLPDGLSNTAQQAEETIEALERLATGDKPFSLHLSLHSPHAPMIPTRRYYEMYNPDDMLLPESLRDDLANSAYSNDRLPDGYDDPTKVQRWMANYFGLITEVDEWLGKLLTKMDELGISENTLLAFSADHGEMLGGHGMREKNNFYEESSHIPLLLYMPGTIPAGTIVDDPVSHLDLHSTFLDFTVGRNDYKTDGTTLRSNIDGTNTNENFVVTMWNQTDASKNYKVSRDPAFMIRKGNWKLILSGQADNENVDMLYNLDEDPSEMNNLLGKNGQSAPDEIIGKAEHLKAMLVKYLKDADHPAAEEIHMRRTWRHESFWSVLTLPFRDTLDDGTRTEYLYIGSPGGETVSLILEGEDTGHYGLKLDSQYGLSDEGFTVVAVRFTTTNIADAESLAPVTLVIELDGGDKREIILSPPKQMRQVAIGKNAGGDFQSTLTFSLNLTPAPSPSPTSAPTPVPTITRYPTLAPTTIPETCFGPSELLPNKRLFAENKPSFICSPNGQYRFGMTQDGNLALWAGKSRVWSAGTCCKGSEAFVAMQGSDGNLVIRSFVEVDSEDEKAQAHWASGTTGNPDASLRIDDDGQARIVNADGIVVWETDVVHQVQPGTSSPSRAGVTTFGEQSEDEEEIVDISSPPVETTLDETDEEKEPLTNIEGSAKSQEGGSSITSKTTGAAIAIFLSAFAFIIAFILIRKGSRQARQSAVSSDSPSSTDGAFTTVNIKRSKIEFDTSIDSDSNSGVEVVIPTGEGNAASSSGFDLSPIIP